MAKCSASFFLAIILLGPAQNLNASLLVDTGSSNYQILHTEKAPKTVVDAARELQRVVKVSTGAELPIVTEASGPVIALGDTTIARKAGLDGSELPFDGFVVRKEGENILIVGNDTLPGQEKWRNQFSNGTWNGTMTFLEEVVGARWLLPGPEGEDIPSQPRLEVQTLDIRQQPGFKFRCLTTFHNNPPVTLWSEHNKLNPNYRAMSFGHAWEDHPSLDVIKAHPEYMRMRDDGQREPVPASQDKAINYCLTQEGLIQAYADSLIEGFERDPKLYHGIMSSSDGFTGCACPDCKKLELTGSEWNDYGGYGHSITPLMLHFYEGVARRVGEKFPDRIVGGYAYRNYQYPPAAPAEPIDNLLIQIAVLNNYGYKLYKPERAGELAPMIEGWRKYAGHLGYSDYSTWMRNGYGVPLPPGREILKLLFPVMGQSKPDLVIYTGHEAWGTGALHNYVVAKLLWDPEADVEKLCSDFLNRAYGEEAAPKIGEIFWTIEESMADYIRSFGNKPRDPAYNVDYQFIEKVCAPHLAKIEQLFREAQACPLTSAQRARLDMLGTGLAVLHFNMRKAGLAGQQPEQSPLYRSDKDYTAMLEKESGGLVLDTLSKPGVDGTLRVLSPPDGRTATVPRLMAGFAPPSVDGSLEDPAWEEAVELSDFRTRNQRSPATVPTKVKLTSDDEAVYLGIQCDDPDPAGILASTTQRDSTGIFNDDTFEIFLGHPKDYKRSYWHIALNPAGAVFDALANNNRPNLQFDSAAKKTPNGWTAEVRIPFSKLGLPRTTSGNGWRVNFARGRKSSQPESTTWNGVDNGFHEPQNFGTLQFAP